MSILPPLPSRRILPLLLACAVPLAAPFAATVAAQAPIAPAGAVSGRVSTEVFGGRLEGATVRIPALNRETVTARDGSFVFTGVPAGNYTIVVSYEGLQTVQADVTVGAGESRRQDFVLGADIIQLGEMIVAARVEGQAEAINLQRTAPSLRTVVSADALGQIREGNIGDALVRLPGLSVETRAGVQRTATIRGLAPQYNTVTVNGLRMTNVDGNRDIALDSFPSNMLGRVEVIKANTPDLPADAIGGTVNLITRTAFDRDGRVLEGDIGTTYNDLRRNWNRQASLTFADRFGSEGQFGLLTSLAYFRDERGYDVAQTGYTGQFINRTLYYDRYEVKDKVGAGLAFDFRPSHGDAKYFFNALYNYDYRFLNHYGTDWRPNPATATVSGNTVTSTNGRVDAFAFYREPKNVFQMYTLGGENALGDWTADYRVAYSKAKKDYPATIQIVTSFNGVNLAYDRSQPDFPAFTVTNNVNVNNPAGLQFRQAQTTQVPRVEDEWSYDANIRRHFVTGATPWSLAFGARVTLKDASQAQPDTIRYTGLTNPAASDLIEFRDTPRFLRAGGNRATLLGFYPNWKNYRYLFNNEPQLFTQTAAARLFSDETRANADWAIAEDIYGLYAQATVDLNRLRLLGGLRWERTEIDSQANEVTVAGGQVTNVRRVSASSSYNKLLPGVHARYSVSDRFILRAAVTQALSRPPPGDLIPSKQENAQINQRIIGNPNLQPAEALGIDLSAEYYLPPLGVLSAAFFYKDIDNFVFSASRIAPDGVDERTRTNGDGGKVRGVELVWNQQLAFLPAPFDGFGIEANYTLLDSEGVYPNRSDKLPFLNSPDYIFNGIISWARGPVGVRLSYNRLPERLESVGSNPNADNYNAASAVWDLAVRYRVFGRHQLFLNVKNLTDEPTVQYVGTRERPTMVVYYGTQYNFGLNFAF